MNFRIPSDAVDCRARWTDSSWFDGEGRDGDSGAAADGDIMIPINEASFGGSMHGELTTSRIYFSII